MANDAAAAPQAMVIPICQHCGEEFAGMGIFMWQVEGWLVISAYCPSCRVTLQTQMVPFSPPPDGTGEVIPPRRIHLS
jgi:hypothetical protein